ncbi:golgi snare 12 [Perilla frutescens var. hirtella]|nr:golgi snare 12 [Perilla frutescens var. hirtella]
MGSSRGNQNSISAENCVQASAVAGFKSACITCVATAIPTLLAVRTIPWAKTNLNYTGQALIISGDRCALLRRDGRRLPSPRPPPLPPLSPGRGHNFRQALSSVFFFQRFVKLKKKLRLSHHTNREGEEISRKEGGGGLRWREVDSPEKKDGVCDRSLQTGRIHLDPNMDALQESGWEELRKQSRKIEGNIDVKLSSSLQRRSRKIEGDIDIKPEKNESQRTSIAAYFIAADKTILEGTRKNADARYRRN